MKKCYKCGCKLYKSIKCSCVRSKIIYEDISDNRFSKIELKNQKFYNGDRWKKLKNIIKRIFGRRCMSCESTENIEVDHIKPKGKYDKLKYDPNNLQVLCRTCNRTKINIPETDYRTEAQKEKLKLVIRKNKFLQECIPKNKPAKKKEYTGVKFQSGPKTILIKKNERPLRRRSPE